MPEVGKVWAIVGIILSNYLGELKNVKHIATSVFSFFSSFSFSAAMGGKKKRQEGRPMMTLKIGRDDRL